MKFMRMTVAPADRVAEIGAASDKGWASVPRERRPEAIYTLMCVPFDVPPNSIVTVTIEESDSAEAMVARAYPLIQAGGTVNIIPVLEVPIAGAAKTEKKYKG